MAKVTPGAIIESIRGKLGGSVFRKTRAGHILTPTVNPRQQQTAAESRTRANLNKVTGDWYSLTDLQKQVWNKYASLLPGPLSGFNVYVRNNCRLLDANHASLTQISHAPYVPMTPTFVQGFAATPDNGSNTITWTAPNVGNQWVQIQYSIQVGFSMTGKERWVLLPAVASNLLTATHTITLPTGYRISYRARTIENRGRVSPWTAATLSEAPPPPPGPGEWMGLREHQDLGSHPSGQMEFLADQGADHDLYIKIVPTTACCGYAIQTCDASYLDGMQVRVRWAGNFPGATLSWGHFRIYDGAYPRDDDVLFPEHADIVLQGNGILEQISRQGGFGKREDSLFFDAAEAAEDQVTIMVQFDHWHNVGGCWVAIQWLRILDAGPSIIHTFDLSSVTMERAGTHEDYGYTASGP